MIEVSSPGESERLLKVTKVHGHKVSCIPRPTYNQSRGVLYAPELLTIDTEEIQSELKEQNVVTVVRMKKKVESGHIPLPTLILTFNSYRLPNIIRAGWLTFKVKPYIPSPLRCFHCQVFGYSIQKCKKKLGQELAVCVNCGKAAHGECKDTPSCINCGGEHSASSKSCPRFIYEKVLEKVFKEAKRRASEKQIRSGELFSSVIKNSRGQQNNQNITKENESDRREQPENEVVETTHRKHPLTTKPNKNLVINSEPKTTSSENENDRREQSENEVVETTCRKHPLTTKPIKNLVINSEPKNTSLTSKHKTIPTKPDNTKIPAAATLKSKVPRKTSEIPAQVDKNKLNKKRERPSDEKPNENGSDRDEPSSQGSVVIPRNVVKFKRLEFGGKK